MIERPTGLQLRDEIDAYRARTGMSATDFGVHSGSSHNIVTMLRFIARPRPTTVQRLRNFMAENPDGMGKNPPGALVLPPMVRAGLAPHAGKRRISVNELAAKLLGAIAADDMVEAVLDDADSCEAPACA